MTFNPLLLCQLRSSAAPQVLGGGKEAQAPSGATLPTEINRVSFRLP